MSVERWLDARRPAMPAPLRRAVDAALERADAGGRGGALEAADRLADAALHTLAAVVRAAPERDMAADLLAADALLTYACEAAAEAGPEAVDELTGRLDSARFAAVLEDSS